MSSNGYFLKAVSFSLCYSAPDRPSSFFQKAHSLWDELKCDRLRYPVNIIFFDTVLVYDLKKGIRWLREAASSLEGIKTMAHRENVDTDLVASVNYLPNTSKIASKLIHRRLFEEALFLRLYGCEDEIVGGKPSKKCSEKFGRIADLMCLSMEES